MTTYDSTVGARPNLANGATAAQEKINNVVEPVRKRPVASSATALAVAAVAAAGVIGGRKYVQARRSRSRWQQVLDKLPLGRFR
ncbi:hypothetical protein [Actinoplanes subglobosus]|uniref:Uncharacterized protein n=1 Tax=Actinoplanes subglobosus TaxID=1547892 RepID=A0ABV8J503_9ACTN